MREESIYAFAGGEPAFLALAAAHHERCLADPVLNHPFAHPDADPDHVQHLAAYWAEVFGGPTAYSRSLGGHTGMLTMHAGQGIDPDLGERFVSCFAQAIEDADLPKDADFRDALVAYMRWAMSEVESYSPSGSQVAGSLAMPRWSWDGPQ
jgi:hemoglobin